MNCYRAFLSTDQTQDHNALLKSMHMVDTGLLQHVQVGVRKSRQLVGCSDVSAVRGLQKERCDERARLCKSRQILMYKGNSIEGKYEPHASRASFCS